MSYKKSRYLWIPLPRAEKGFYIVRLCRDRVHWLRGPHDRYLIVYVGSISLLELTYPLKTIVPYTVLSLFQRLETLYILSHSCPNETKEPDANTGNTCILHVFLCNLLYVNSIMWVEGRYLPLGHKTLIPRSVTCIFLIQEVFISTKLLVAVVSLTTANALFFSV